MVFFVNDNNSSEGYLCKDRFHLLEAVKRIYLVLTNVFSNIVNIYAPLKKQILRGNDAPFMNKELRKAIYTRNRLRYRYFKISTRENETSYIKSEINVCQSEGSLSHNIFLR